MSRRHADTVEVRRRDDVPEQFLWHGRLYQVREVLARWIEAGAWWRSAPSSALFDGTERLDGAERFDGAEGSATAGRRAETLTLAPIPSSPAWAQRAWGEPAPDVGAAVGPMTLDDGEREFWRVEAQAGRAASPGVYDLCFDWSANRWQLVRVVD